MAEPQQHALAAATLVSLAEIFAHGAEDEIARAESLLADFHRNIYVPAFPDPSEREDMDEWLPLLRGGVKEGYTLHPELLVSAEGQVLAGLMWEHYERSHSVLATYLAVHPAARRAGVAQRLVDAMAARARGLSTAGGSPPVYAETRDPHLTPPETHTEDVTRLHILDGLGFRLLDCAYLQPPLEPGGPYCDHLRLACLGVSVPETESMPARGIASFLDDFFACLSLRTGEAPSPAWRALLEALQARESVALQRLTTLSV